MPSPEWRLACGHAEPSLLGSTRSSAYGIAWPTEPGSDCRSGIGAWIYVALSARDPRFRGVRAAIVFPAVAFTEVRRIARNAKATSDEHA